MDAPWTPQADWLSDAALAVAAPDRHAHAQPLATEQPLHAPPQQQHYEQQQQQQYFPQQHQQKHHHHQVHPFSPPGEAETVDFAWLSSSTSESSSTSGLTPTASVPSPGAPPPVVSMPMTPALATPGGPLADPAAAYAEPASEPELQFFGGGLLGSQRDAGAPAAPLFEVAGGDAFSPAFPGAQAVAPVPVPAEPVPAPGRRRGPRARVAAAPGPVPYGKRPSPGVRGPVPVRASVGAPASAVPHAAPPARVPVPSEKNRRRRIAALIGQLGELTGMKTGTKAEILEEASRRIRQAKARRHAMRYTSGLGLNMLRGGGTPSGVHIVVVGMDLMVRDANDVWLSRIQYERADVARGIGCAQLTRPQDMPTIAAVTSLMVSGRGLSATDLFPWYRKDGTLLWSYGKGELVRDGSPDEHYFIIMGTEIPAPADGRTQAKVEVLAEDGSVEIVAF